MDPNRGFTIHRRLGASPDQVFQAWTEPDRLEWFGSPDADHATSVDLREGGCWRTYLVQPDGECYWTGGTYREIIPDERICFTWGTEGGWPDLDPARPDKNPILTVTLAAIAPAGFTAPRTTAMALHIDFPEGIHDDDVQRWLHLGIEPGWTDTIDRLVRYLG